MRFWQYYIETGGEADLTTVELLRQRKGHAALTVGGVLRLPELKGDGHGTEVCCVWNLRVTDVPFTAPLAMMTALP
jgi:hypothetical protein